MEINRDVYLDRLIVRKHNGFIDVTLKYGYESPDSFGNCSISLGSCGGIQRKNH